MPAPSKLQSRAEFLTTWCPNEPWACLRCQARRTASAIARRWFGCSSRAMSLGSDQPLAPSVQAALQPADPVRAPRTVFPTLGLRGFKLIPALDQYPSVVRFAQTMPGRLVVVATFLLLVQLSP